MMKKILKFNLGKRIWKIVKQNKMLSIATIVFITFSGVNLLLIYSFVQVLETF